MDVVICALFLVFFSLPFVLLVPFIEPWQHACTPYPTLLPTDIIINYLDDTGGGA